jgi:hypothetical protein
LKDDLVLDLTTEDRAITILTRINDVRFATGKRAGFRHNHLQEWFEVRENVLN